MNEWTTTKNLIDFHVFISSTIKGSSQLKLFFSTVPEAKRFIWRWFKSSQVNFSEEFYTWNADL